MPGPKGSKNKNPAQGRKTIFANTTISGYPEEIEQLKQKAKAAGKTVSRYVLDSLLN